MKNREKEKIQFVPVALFVALVVICLVLIGKSIIPNKRNDRTVLNRGDSYYNSEAFSVPTSHPGIRSTVVMKIPIIMYHYVEYVRDPNDSAKRKLSTDPGTFERHLRQLRDSQYDTYFVRDVPSLLNGSTLYSSKSAVLTFDDGYEDFYSVVFPLLKKYHVRGTVYIITDFIGRRGFLSDTQIRELAQSDLVEIGSHTLDHVYLKRAKDDISTKQIAESKLYLEKTFSIPVRTFAYPYGAYNKTTVKHVKDAGYSVAVSVIPTVLQSEQTQYILGRIRPGQFPNNNIVTFIESFSK